MTTYFTKAITVYDFDNKLVKTYPEVRIPEKPTWKNYFECLHYLQRQCPVLQMNAVYAITPYYNGNPLFALEGALFPQISPPIRSAPAWDLKPTQKWADINSYRKLDNIEKLLEANFKQQERQTETLNGIKDNTTKSSDIIFLNGEYYRKVDKADESKVSAKL